MQFLKIVSFVSRLSSGLLNKAIGSGACYFFSSMFVLPANKGIHILGLKVRHANYNQAGQASETSDIF